jgi:hypothetical protein
MRQRNAYRNLVENHKEGHHSGELDKGRRIILKWILRKYGVAT